MGAALTSTAMFWYAARRGFLDPEEASTTDVRANLAGGLAAVAAFVPSIPLAFVVPEWAKLSWGLLIPFSFIAGRMSPDRERGGLAAAPLPDR